MLPNSRTDKQSAVPGMAHNAARQLSRKLLSVEPLLQEPVAYTPPARLISQS